MWATLRKGGCVGLRRPVSTGEAAREAEAEEEAEAGEELARWRRRAGDGERERRAPPCPWCPWGPCGNSGGGEGEEEAEEEGGEDVTMRSPVGW